MGLTGVTVASPGDEVVIYRVQLVRSPPDDELLLGIGVVIEDLTTATGMANTDLASLRLWEDQPGATSDAWDLGDNLLGTVNTGAINIGAETHLPVTLGPANLLPGGAGRWYFVTAVISAGAVSGHKFRLRALATNIDIDVDSPPPGGPDAHDGVPDLTLPALPMGASDNDRVEISAGGGGPGPGGGSAVHATQTGAGSGEPIAIPFGGEAVFAVVAAAVGVAWLARRR
ncbi:MAG: hypothetical protein AB1505_18175 [Candidatus Latescibacterota bacterium]